MSRRQRHLTWLVDGAEAVVLVHHYGELSGGQHLLIYCGVHKQDGAAMITVIVFISSPQGYSSSQSVTTKKHHNHIYTEQHKLSKMRNTMNQNTNLNK